MGQWVILYNQQPGSRRFAPRRMLAQAISSNSVSETENELEFRTAESDGQSRIDEPFYMMKPEVTDCFSTKFSRKIINNGDRSTSCILAQVRCTRASQRTRRWSFVGAARENTPCALHARRVVFPLAPVDLVHQQRHAADGGFPRPRPIRVIVVCLCLANGAIATATRVARLS